MVSWCVSRTDLQVRVVCSIVQLEYNPVSPDLNSEVPQIKFGVDAKSRPAGLVSI